MKLLSRFMWLIIAVLVIIFAGISIVHFRAENKLGLIKKSISEEYNILIDKMLSPEKAEIYSTYNSEVSNSGNVREFMSLPTPATEILSYDLDTMVMSHFNVDAVWFFKANASPFYFFSHRNLNQGLLNISAENIFNLFKAGRTCNFYVNNNNQITRIFGTIIGETNSPQGFLFSATVLDQRWIDFYEQEINNSEVSFAKIDEKLPEVSKEIIRIERPLPSFDGTTVENMIITLKLPFLSLWQNTTITDSWFSYGAMALIATLLIIALILWVILPLGRISKSLEKGDSHDIQPLIKNTSEMGKVARMISDYHQKNEEIEASESTKRHIIEQVQVGIIISDAASSLIITANPYACEIINAPEDAILGNITQNFFAPLSDELKNKLKNTTENLTGIESFIQSSTGEQIPILRNVTRMFMDGKHAIMETFINLSEIKSLQNKLEDEKKKLSLAMKN